MSGVVRLNSGSPWEGIVGYSRVVVRGDAAWVSGTTSTVDGVVTHPGDAGAQTRQALTILRQALERSGFTLADGRKITVKNGWQRGIVTNGSIG